MIMFSSLGIVILIFTSVILSIFRENLSPPFMYPVNLDILKLNGTLIFLSK